jgi:formylglycine-generating enzyme required for sulfatase activity
MYEVGKKSSNELGLYDMSGNAFEWSSDLYSGKNGSSAVTNPTGGTSGKFGVIRGGSSIYSSDVCRSSWRVYWLHGLDFIILGFRLRFRH